MRRREVLRGAKRGAVRVGRRPRRHGAEVASEGVGAAELSGHHRGAAGGPEHVHRREPHAGRRDVQPRPVRGGELSPVEGQQLRHPLRERARGVAAQRARRHRVRPGGAADPHVDPPGEERLERPVLLHDAQRDVVREHHPRRRGGSPSSRLRRARSSARATCSRCSPARDARRTRAARSRTRRRARASSTAPCSASVGEWPDEIGITSRIDSFTAHLSGFSTLSKPAPLLSAHPIRRSAALGERYCSDFRLTPSLACASCSICHTRLRPRSTARAQRTRPAYQSPPRSVTMFMVAGAPRRKA